MSSRFASTLPAHHVKCHDIPACFTYTVCELIRSRQEDPLLSLYDASCGKRYLARILPSREIALFPLCLGPHANESEPDLAKYDGATRDLALTAPVA